VQANVSNEWIDKFFQGTPLEGYGRAFTLAERKHGVNAIALAKIAAHESAFGTSKITKYKNNIFGFGAYDNSPFLSAKTFESIDECIDTVAGYISCEYIDSSGRHYNGETLKDIGIRWATDRRWAKKVEQQEGRG